MASTPKTLQVPSREIETAKTVEDLKKAIKLLTEELARNHLLFRDDIISLENKGISGWFDDGENFRITTTNGAVTEITDSIMAGHS